MERRRRRIDAPGTVAEFCRPILADTTSLPEVTLQSACCNQLKNIWDYISSDPADVVARGEGEELIREIVTQDNCAGACFRGFEVVLSRGESDNFLRPGIFSDFYQRCSSLNVYLNSYGRPPHSGGGSGGGGGEDHAYNGCRAINDLVAIPHVEKSSQCCAEIQTSLWGLFTGTHADANLEVVRNYTNEFRCNHACGEAYVEVVRGGERISLLPEGSLVTWEEGCANFDFLEEDEEHLECSVIGLIDVFTSEHCCNALNEGALMILSGSSPSELVSEYRCTECRRSWKEVVEEAVTMGLLPMPLINEFDELDGGGCGDITGPTNDDDATSTCKVLGGLFEIETSTECCIDINVAVSQTANGIIADPLDVVNAYRCEHCHGGWEQLVRQATSAGMIPHNLHDELENSCTTLGVCNVMGLIEVEASEGCCDNLQEMAMEILTFGMLNVQGFATPYRCNECRDSYEELVRRAMEVGFLYPADVSQIKRACDHVTGDGDGEGEGSKRTTRIPAGLSQKYVFMPSHMRDVYLVTAIRCLITNAGLKIEQDEDSFKGSGWTTAVRKQNDGEEAGVLAQSCCIFVDKCERAAYMEGTLRELGIDCVALHSLLSQDRRMAALGKFKSQQVRILVATDVASRGLDIPEVDLVINAELPRRAEDYIHRCGRTARAGRRGLAVSLVGEHDVELVHACEELAGRSMGKCEEVKDKDAVKIVSSVSKAQRLTKVKMMELGFDELVQKRKDRKAADNRERQKIDKKMKRGK